MLATRMAVEVAVTNLPSFYMSEEGITSQRIAKYIYCCALIEITMRTV